MKQKTFDDSEPVIESVNLSGETLVSPNSVKPRSRSALEIYDQLQEMKLVEEDPLY